MFKGKIRQNPHTAEKAFTIRGKEAQSKTTPKRTVKEKPQNTALCNAFPKQGAAQHDKILPEKMHIVTPHVTWKVLLLSISLLVFLLAT